ncbi:hypothetical protein TSUD_390620 [Trifolium subterraneum]|uniref:Uncharacterized protein n=1 Tax=Trifolium subterraneum TaxID=3900 RepID=A0A2Z6NZG9_TRISU|nr:hypothetical protein TSUD_390620 [Trifolium subterraneum]
MIKTKIFEFALNNKVDPYEDIGKTIFTSKISVTVSNVEMETIDIVAGSITGG